MSESQRPKVGVGVIIHDRAGNVVMGERAGAHGAGNSISPHLSIYQFLDLYSHLLFVVTSSVISLHSFFLATSCIDFTFLSLSLSLMPY